MVIHFWALLHTKMTEVPLVSYTSISEIPTYPFLYLKPEKVPLLYRPLQGITPRPPPREGLSDLYIVFT